MRVWISLRKRLTLGALHMTTPRASYVEQLERSFAAKLEKSIAIAETARGNKITNKGLTEDLAELGIGVAESHLSHLRRTAKARPSAWLVAGLAVVLDVPVTYFVPEDPITQEPETIAALKALGEPGHRLIQQVVGLSAGSVEMVLTLMAYLREQEHLPPARGSR